MSSTTQNILGVLALCCMCLAIGVLLGVAWEDNSLHDALVRCGLIHYHTR